VSHFERSLKPVLDPTCDNLHYEELQGHACGAPGRPALAGLVQWVHGQHAGDALNDRGVPRHRRPGCRESRRNWRGSLARCLDSACALAVTWQLEEAGPKQDQLNSSVHAFRGTPLGAGVSMSMPYLWRAGMVVLIVNAVQVVG
jgi:hypothetical protein